MYLQVVVQHVNVQGLGRTKEDLLGYEISDVFHAKNLIEVCTPDCANPVVAVNNFVVYCVPQARTFCLCRAHR